MKRILSVLLILLMICSFAACGVKNEEQGGEAANVTEPAVTEAEVLTEAPTAEPAATAEPTPTAKPTEAPYITPEGVQTYGNITLELPEGWVVLPGGIGGSEDDNSIFVRESANAVQFVWITICTRAFVDGNLAVETSDDIEPFTVNGVEWQGKQKAFYGEIAGKLYFISLSPGYNYDDEPVQQILASLAENAE